MFSNGQEWDLNLLKNNPGVSGSWSELMGALVGHPGLGSLSVARACTGWDRRWALVSQGMGASPFDVIPHGARDLTRPNGATKMIRGLEHLC